MQKVSVIIPVYGVERYIAKTIQSVLAQTYSNFELIIVDDESPDHSIQICRQFSDTRIKIISQKNRGLAGARNAGIRQAQGEYLAFLDGDDLWLPQKLEKHIQHLEHSPKVGVSFSRSALIDEAGNSLNTFLMPKLTDITVTDLFKGSPIGNGSAAVIRRAVFDDIQYQDNLYGTEEDFYFDDRFRRSEDIECWLRILIQTSWKIEGISEALTLYRINSNGLSANLLKQYESWKQVLSKVNTYAPALSQKYDSLAKAYNLRYLARNAVRLKDGKMAVKLINHALSIYSNLILEEPLRTGRTLLAAYSLSLLPDSLYHQMESMAAKLIGKKQQRQIIRERA